VIPNKDGRQEVSYLSKVVMHAQLTQLQKSAVTMMWPY
jgi:ureidoglycolate hydrolase